VILGGVSASSGDAYENAFCLGCGTPAPSLSTNLGTTSNSFTPGASSTPSAGGGTSFQGNTTPAPTQTAAAQPVVATKPGGARGGALAGVGLAGLGMVLAMAEGDRRKMRRAQREIPQFEE
jgi:hypothetical protein